MEYVGVFEMYKVGIGPSSSHTMGPWKAALLFVQAILPEVKANKVKEVSVFLYGSLAKTGVGHGTHKAVMMGLSGFDYETVPTSMLASTVDHIKQSQTIAIGSVAVIPFDPSVHIQSVSQLSLEGHANGIRFVAELINGTYVHKTYYSVGGGFVVEEGVVAEAGTENVPMYFTSGEELLRYAHERAISDVMRANEYALRSAAEVDQKLDQIWRVMKECVFEGVQTTGILPGGLNVKRRASELATHLSMGMIWNEASELLAWLRHQPLSFEQVNKWISCFALAVNEVNASFGRVVTAPTNGAAGVVPAVLMYYAAFSEQASEEGVKKFLFTSAAVGSIFKKNATISAAMGGCQAEIGVSSAMAAAGLTECLGGTPQQVLMAAEIAMEHHLGMTCDPIGGLVQVPCIERNTMGAMKAITAAYLALESDPSQARVSLDTVVQTMWQTALDMNQKYKETAEGGLAMHISVNVPEC